MHRVLEPRGEDLIMVDKTAANGGRGRRMLSPSQKYEIWLQLVRGEVTVAEAAAAQRVDRTTIVRIKQVAKDGALTALATSKPGTAGQQRDYKLEQAQAEINRLSEACKELGVKLALVEGKDAWG
jgi:transposase-like protein